MHWAEDPASAIPTRLASFSMSAIKLALGRKTRSGSLRLLEPLRQSMTRSASGANLLDKITVVPQVNHILNSLRFF
jgi:hypothetical protein